MTLSCATRDFIRDTLSNTVGRDQRRSGRGVEGEGSSSFLGPDTVVPQSPGRGGESEAVPRYVLPPDEHNLIDYHRHAARGNRGQGVGCLKETRDE